LDLWAERLGGRVMRGKLNMSKAEISASGAHGTEVTRQMSGSASLADAPVKIVSITAGLGLLGACATPAPPPPPPPPPPPAVETTPYRPIPPSGASYVLQIPPKNNLGQRITVNLAASPDERVWHFRASWNVAALNCTSAQFDPVLAAYSAYISDYGPELKVVNDRIEAVYRSATGSNRAALKAREEHMTSVYNFFALPPARNDFCAAALELSNRYLQGPVDPIAFAQNNFALMEAPFERFYTEYEQYQCSSVDWDNQYGAQFGPSQPGWVAVQNARAQGIPVPTMGCL